MHKCVLKGKSYNAFNDVIWRVSGVRKRKEFMPAYYQSSDVEMYLSKINELEFSNECFAPLDDTISGLRIQ